MTDADDRGVSGSPSSSRSRRPRVVARHGLSLVEGTVGGKSESPGREERRRSDDDIAERLALWLADVAAEAGGGLPAERQSG